MSVGEAAQLMTAVAALVAALASLRNGRKIDVVHKATNSMKDELVAASAEAAHAAGVIDGAAAKARDIIELAAVAAKKLLKDTENGT